MQADSALPTFALRLADRLAEAGFAVLDGVLPAALDAVLAELARQRAQAMHTAGIGRGRDHLVDRDIRRDRTLWLGPDTPAERDFLAWLEALRLLLNRELFLGLFDVEAQFAWHPPGAFYRRHFDAFHDASGVAPASSNRVLSAVFYLNPGWSPGDGGELLLFDPQAGRVLAEVQPQAGRAVFFLSERFPHEVLPVRCDRYSIAAWFRRNGSTASRVDPPS